MHSFNIALISTLSLGVHAASIGDSVSQLVTRQQHNRLFHNPDFTSANLPAAESFEHARKFSPRQLTIDSDSGTVGGPLSGMLAISKPNAQANAQANARAFTTPSFGSPGSLGDFISGMLTANDNANTVNNSPLNAQTVATAQVANANNAQAVVDSQAAVIAQAQTQAAAEAQAQAAANALLQAQAAQAQAQAQAQAAQAQAQAQAQAAARAQVQAQAAQAQASQFAIMAQVAQAQVQAAQTQAASMAQAAVNAQAAANSQFNAGSATVPPIVDNTLQVAQDSATLMSSFGAAPLSNPLSQAVNNLGVGIGRLSGNTATVGAQQDVVKRQVPAAPAVPALPISLPTTLIQAGNNTGVMRREDNMKFFDDEVEDIHFSVHDSEADELDDQVEDMDFSTHDLEADELEEGF